MERLTEKRRGVNVIPLRNAVTGLDIPQWSIESPNDLEKFLSGAAADRLAAYEDTGLEPDDVSDLLTIHRGMADNEYVILDEELRSMFRAKSEGRLLVPPCKVGDTVYEVQPIRKRVQPLEIISVYIGRMGDLFFNWELKDGIGIYQNVKGFGASQLGRTVFLTREEAEAALKGEGNG